jgi:hypothetical protein
MAKISDNKVLIQLRISPEERDELKDAGTRAGRSLPNEILYRLGEYRRGSPGGVDRAIGDLAAVIAGRADATLSDLFGNPRVTLIRNEARDSTGVLLNVSADFADPQGMFDVVSGIPRDFAAGRYRRNFADPKMAARRSEILALTRDAMVKVFDDLGAASAVPTSGAHDAAEVTGPDMVAGITFDLTKKIRTPRQDDDTPEGRVLARIGKALGVQQKEASHE